MENWVSSSGIIQTEAAAFVALGEGDCGIRNLMQRVHRNHGSHWPLAFLVYQKRLTGFSTTKGNNEQTNNTSVVPLRALDPKEKSNGFPFYFAPIPLQTKASHRSEKNGI